MGLSSAGLANLFTAHRWFHDAYTVGDVDGALAVLDPAVRSDGMGEPVVGIEAHGELARGLRRTWPVCHVRFEDAVESGDRLAVRCRVRGRHHASPAPLDFVGGVFLRFKAGKIVHAWNSWDFYTALSGSGHVAPGALAACLAPSGRTPAPAPTRRGAPPRTRGAGREELVRRWSESAYGARNLQAIDDLLTPDVFAHGLGQSITGREAFAASFYLPFMAAFPEARFEVTDVIGDGDVVAVRVDVEGTHVGGARVRFSGGGFVHFRGERIAGVHNCWDFLSMLEQTGAVAPGRMAAASAG